MSIVKLQSGETEEVFEVSREIAELSSTISNIIVDVGEIDSPIPLGNVSAPILKKVIEYCKHYHETSVAGTGEDKKDEKRSDDISAWERDFCNVDQPVLFELILAANYLDIKPLLDVTCKTVANMIKGKTPEEIRKTFNIKNDFTPEEEEQVRRENAWCEDS